MPAVFHAAGDDADHALVKAGVEQHHGRRLRALARQLGEQRLGLLVHAGLQIAPLAVDGVERGGQFVGARRIVGEQALDAQRHVGQPAGGVDARPDREAEVFGAAQRGVAPGGRQQRRHAGLHAAAADALQALRHQPAVVGVELDHVGHGAQRHQVEQAVQPRLRGLG